MPTYPWPKGQSGNPKGRPKGRPSKRQKTVLETLARLDYNPFEKKIALARRLEAKIQTNHFASAEDRRGYLVLYAEVLKDLLQYVYPKLRAVEHFGQVELVQKLQNLDTIPDEELQALLTEAEELARVATHG